MTPVAAIKTCLRKYMTFSGRASRSEYWWFAAACLLVLVMLEILQGAVWGWTLKNGSVSSVLTTGFTLAIGLPFLAALIRRTQDIGLHPIFALVPGLVLYGLVPVLYNISFELKSASGLVGSDARRASFDTVSARIASPIRLWANVWVPVYYLVLTALPTDFVRPRTLEQIN